MSGPTLKDIKRELSRCSRWEQEQLLNHLVDECYGDKFSSTFSPKDIEQNQFPIDAKQIHTRKGSIFSARAIEGLLLMAGLGAFSWFVLAGLALFFKVVAK